MKKLKAFLPLAIISLALGMSISSAPKQATKLEAEGTASTTIGFGEGIINYVNNSGQPITTNQYFDYTIGVGTLCSGEQNIQGSAAAEYCTRSNNPELGNVENSLNYSTGWKCGFASSQLQSRIHFIITAKRNISIDTNVLLTLASNGNAYAQDSEFSYYVFDGEIPSQNWCSANRTLTMKFPTAKADIVQSVIDPLNCTTTLKAGQKFVVEWGFQYSGARKIMLAISGVQQFNFVVTPTNSTAELLSNKIVYNVSKNSGSDVTATAPFASYGVYQGHVGENNINGFSTIAENSLKDTGVSALNWCLKPSLNHNIIYKFVAAEKMLIKVSRQAIGNDFLDGTYIRYWHNSTLDKEVFFAKNSENPADFSYEHILNKGDVFYYEFGSWSEQTDRTMGMKDDINTTLPKFEAFGFEFATTNLHATHSAVKIDGTAKTCSKDGNKDYYRCEVCDALFEDEACTTPIADLTAWKAGSGKVSASHAPEKQDGQAATCLADGWKDYYKCADCDALFEDEACTTPIADLAAWKVGDGKIEKHNHTMTYHKAEEATCTTDGTVEYWSCSECEKNYADEAGTQVLTNIVDPSEGHHMTHYEAVPADCKNEGSVEYWYCSVCEKYFADEAGTTEITNTVVPVTNHSVEKQDGKAATCKEAGWKDYYKCSVCGDLFEDEACTTPITDLEAWKVGAGKLEKTTSHNIEKVDGKAPTCTEAGWKDYYECKGCSTYFADAEGTQTISDLEAWKVGDGKIAAKGHKGEKQDGQAATCLADGWKDYYKCSECGKYFEDEDCTVEITNIEAWKVGAGKVTKVSHELTKVDGKAPTCTKSGYKDAWFCSKCNLYYADAEGTEVIGNAAAYNIWKSSKGEGYLAEKGHTYTFVEEVPATKDAPGMKEHYVCEEDGRLFIKSGEIYVEVTADQLAIQYKFLGIIACGDSLIAISALTSIVSALGIVLVSFKKKED